MRLGEKQELFSRLECQITPKANALGFEVRGGELQRFEQQCRYNATHCRRCKQTKAHRNHTPPKNQLSRHKRHKFRSIGKLNSLHRDKLAKDIILTLGGVVQWNTEAYRELGEWWESLHSLCCWGGYFDDGGHFSITHGRRR